MKPGTAHVGLVLLTLVVALSALAAAGLRMEAATPDGVRLGWVDAAFTAVSAATCTGLETRRVADELAWPGQVIVLITGQLGAWAIMVAGTAVASRAFGLQWAGWRRTVGGVVLISLALELLTGLALWLITGVNVRGAGGQFRGWDVATLPGCLLQGVAAITQSGFTWSDTATAPLSTAAVLLPAMLIGSLGYPTWNAAQLMLTRRRAMSGHGPRANDEARMKNDEALRTADVRHSSVGFRHSPSPSMLTHRHMMSDHDRHHAGRVVRFTAGAFLIGTAVIALGQATPHLHTALHLGVQGHGRYTPAFTPPDLMPPLRHGTALSASARSTGLDVVPPDTLYPATRVALLPLMLLGGGLGSAAGGVGLWVLYRRPARPIFPTTDPPTRQVAALNDHTDALPRAARTVLLGFIGIITAAWFVLVLVEPYPPDRLLFEAVSAATTVGLPTGLTPTLTDTGKLTLTTAMLLGRALPLAALSRCLSR